MDSQQTNDYYQHHAAARLSVLLIVCVSSFLTPLSLSGSLVAVPAIAAGLHADAVYASWIPAAFLLSNLLGMLPAGRLADIHGRKRIFLLGGVVFALGSLLAGFAPNIELLLLCRIVQGLGSALFFSTGMAIIGSVYQHHGRGAALGWMVSSIYLGMTCGPLVGGWLTDQFGWQAIFLFTVPWVLLMLLLAAFQMKGEWRSPQADRLDVLGTLYMALAIIGLFVGVSLLPAGVAVGWLVVGVVFAYVFIRHCHQAPNPLVRLKLVRENLPLSRALRAAIMVYASNYGLLFLLGLYLQYNRGLSPTDAGKMLMVQALVMAALAPVAGKLSDHYRPRLIATLGCVAMVTGTLVLFALLPNPLAPLWVVAVALVAFGVGFGLFSTPNSNAVLGAVPPERMGIASALLNVSRLLGQMLGTTVVTLLMSVHIGSVKITPEQYPALFEVLTWAVVLALLSALMATYFSMERRVAAQG